MKLQGGETSLGMLDLLASTDIGELFKSDISPQETEDSPLQTVRHRLDQWSFWVSAYY